MQDEHYLERLRAYWKHHKVRHGARPSRAQRCGASFPLNTRNQYRRPDAAAYLSQNDMPDAPVSLPRPIRTEAIGLFYQWPNEQEWWPDVAGDFARVVALALCFPASSDDIEVACEHLCVAGAEEWRALEDACEDLLAPVR